MAFALSISLTLVMVLVNHSELETKPQQMVITAIFCIVGSAMYLIYMSVNRLLSIVLMSIESTDYGTLKRKRSHRLAHLTSTASNPKPSAADVEEAVKIAEGYEEEEEEEEDNVKPLLSASLQKEREWKGVRREDIIASMYLGGSGAFLALPALCMWDTSVTVAFLASMQFGSVWEKVKVLEYKPNVDRVTAIGILRGKSTTAVVYDCMVFMHFTYPVFFTYKHNRAALVPAPPYDAAAVYCAVARLAHSSSSHGVAHGVHLCAIPSPPPIGLPEAK